jgi:DNA-directed RNA polymerase subunit RPC12/RpoP
MKLIKQYAEGLKIYKCDGCGRIVHISKNIAIGKAQCIYCGTKETKAENKI